MLGSVCRMVSKSNVMRMQPLCISCIAFPVYSFILSSVVFLPGAAQVFTNLGTLGEIAELSQSSNGTLATESQGAWLMPEIRLE